MSRGFRVATAMTPYIAGELADAMFSRTATTNRSTTTGEAATKAACNSLLFAHAVMTESNFNWSSDPRERRSRNGGISSPAIGAFTSTPDLRSSARGFELFFEFALAFDRCRQFRVETLDFGQTRRALVIGGGA